MTYSVAHIRNNYTMANNKILGNGFASLICELCLSKLGRTRADIGLSAKELSKILRLK